LFEFLGISNMTMDPTKTPSTDDLVACFYRCAAAELPWESALEMLRLHFGAMAVALYGLFKQTRLVAFSHEAGQAAPEATLDYIRKYQQMDPRMSLAMGEPVGAFVSLHVRLDDQFIAHDPFYQEFLIPYGMRHSSGGKVFEDDELVVVLGIHRPVGMPHLSDSEIASGHALLKHLQNAFEIFLKRRGLQEQGAVGLQVLARIPRPIVLVDEHRRIAFANESANQLMQRGPLLGTQGGLLCGKAPDDDMRLLLGIRALGLSTASYLAEGHTSPQDRVFLCLKDEAGARLGVYLYPIRSDLSMGAFGPHNLALLMLHDPVSTKPMDAFTISVVWNLTPAEAKVAAAVCQGQTTADIAAAHGVSVNTVRTQIQSAMEKLGVNRQAEMVSKLALTPEVLL
jgi:DNA-binding CsgD family transcriptional regulator